MAGGISFGGIATGIDTASIIKQLMSIERNPANVMQSRSNRFQGQANTLNQISSLLASLGTLVDGFKSASSLSGRTVSNSAATTATVTADATAAVGAHSIAVRSLAKNQVQVSGGFASATALTLNTGTIKIDAGTATEKIITVTEGNNSLSGIAALLTSAGAALGATVVNTGSGATPYVLSLTGSDASDHVIDFSGLTVAPVGGNAVPAPVLAQITPSSKASFTLDGVDMLRNSNSFSDAVDGLTITLLAADETTPKRADFSVNYDSAGVTAKINSFVGKYNEIITLLQKQSAYDAGTKTTGTLSGDSTVRMLRRDLQSLISAEVSGVSGYSSLASLGIRTDQKAGTISVDAEKLTAALSGGFDKVVAMLTNNSGQIGKTAGTYGIFERFSQLSTRYTKAYQGSTSDNNGIIAARVNGLTSSMAAITKQIETLEARLVIKEAAYKKTYSALETLVSSINGQGSSMLATLERMSNY